MRKLLVKIIFILFLAIISAPSVLAQSFFLSPSSGEYSLGKDFSISLKLESAGTQINAGQTTVKFSPDILAVKSISKSGSIFQLWPQEPIFSNSAGTINFGGGVPAPGFSGIGNILIIKFTGKKEGSAAVSISGGSILAADGRGTNVMKGGAGGVYIITKSAAANPVSTPKSTPKNEEVIVDTTPPLPFDIRVDNYNDATSPELALYFEAKDDLSGIAGYEIKIDNEDIIKVDMAHINPYIMPLQESGNHKVIVWALDKAGNRTESQKEIVIESIAVPEIMIYPKTYNAGEEIFYLEGRALPDAKVIVYFADEKDYVVKTWEVGADKDGNWTLSHKELFKDGVYQTYAKNKDKRGAISIASEKKKTKVILKGISFGSYLISFSWFINFLWLLILLLILIMIYIYNKIKREKKRVKKETLEAEESLKKTFNDLRTRMAKKIEYWDSKPGFSHEERRIYNEIVEVLQKSEKIIKKEIEDIEEK